MIRASLNMVESVTDPSHPLNIYVNLWLKLHTARQFCVTWPLQSQVIAHCSGVPEQSNVSHPKHQWHSQRMGRTWDFVQYMERWGCPYLASGQNQYRRGEMRRLLAVSKNILHEEINVGKLDRIKIVP
jgi:hypothetical protein